MGLRPLHLYPSPASKSHQHLPPLSASGHCWGTHTHNRLTNAKVGKLAAIGANLRLFEPDTEPFLTRFGRDSEDEEESGVEAEDMEDVVEVQEEATET